MKCKFCNGCCKKDGHQKNGTQRYKCKECSRKQQASYVYNACEPTVNHTIVKLIKEGVGIMGMSRLLEISTTTLFKRILSISCAITPPHVVAGAIYEVDEIKSFVGRKSNPIWIAYALNRKDKSIACFTVGPRTNETLRRVLDNSVIQK